MDPALVLEAISTFALVGGLLFAGFQWRQARGASAREAQLLMLQSLEREKGRAPAYEREADSKP